ncbi:hypothetical protein M3557_08285 [Bhargavaea ginsengi]|uniref:hypothetical protein n=1 Tax=Bhargavaea ginsengi TaxID=426757 RepID=UPI00203EE98D|nr:hypothetical protein [Bhargavaea ginsengi]MCM3087907.1 hypothetical protein [Bhargavaea ginsengi]
MNKRLLATIFGSALLLVACGGETTEPTSSEPEETKTQEVEEEQAETSEDGFTKEFEQVIVDNENIKATLTKVEKVVDEMWDEEKVEVTFEVENKREDTIEVQAREVSADGKMVDDMMLNMSQEVSGGKLADAVLEIQNYEGDLPQMEDNIEMILHTFSWDNMDYTEDNPVSIDLK